MLTADSRTVRPGGCRLPRGVDEYQAAEALAELGLDLVDESLHALVHATTFSAYGVSLLSASDVVHALLAAGIERPWRLSDSASGTPHVLELLRVLAKLMDRRHAPIEGLELVAIVPCHGDIMAPATQCTIVENADHKALFELLDPALLIVDQDRLRELCPPLLEECQPLTAIRVAEIIEGIDPSIIPAVARDLLDWFDDHRGELRSADVALRIASLPIFPSASGACLPLTQMSLQSQFRDPIGISPLVDMRLAEGHVDLLRLLGAEDLGAEEYLTRHVGPRARASDLSAEQLRGVLEVVRHERDHLDPGLFEDLPLVLCLDGVARVAADVHLPSSNLSKIAPETPVAQVIALSPALSETLVWLGVSEHPNSDVLSSAAERLASAATDTSTAAALAMLEEIRRVQGAAGSFPAALDAVKEAAWLPVEGGGRRRPSQVYATFNRYLFETQGPKLNLPVAQQQAFSETFRWLGIPSQPSTSMVIAHLRECARTGAAMHDEVYRTLGEADEQHLVRALHDEACVQVAAGHFVQPATTYWTDSGLGQWTHHLPPAMRKYQDFFERVGVQEAPGPVEIETVLGNIAKRMGHEQVDEGTLAVVHRCWALLSGLLTESPDEARLVLRKLGRTSTLADTRGVLVQPESLVFRDARSLCAQFRLLADSVTPRDNATWRALDAAGVQSADDLISIEATELDAEPDAGLRDHLDMLHAPMRRLLAGLIRDDEKSVDWDVLAHLALESAPSLSVRYVLDIWNRREVTDALEVDAVFLAGDHRIVYKRADPPPYRGIARELARCLLPQDDPVRIAASPEALLRASSSDDASGMLDEWGTPELEFGEYEVLESSAAHEVITDAVIKLGPDDGLDGGDSDWQPQVFAPDGGAAADDQQKDGGSETDDVVSQATASAPSKGVAPEASRGTSQQEQGSHGAGSEIGTGPARQNRSKNRAAAPQSKLRSYVVCGDEGDAGTHGDEAPDRSPIDDAGIARVLEFEESRGRYPQEQDHANPGFDILSSDADGEPLRRIEVKSTGGAWSTRGVMLSRRQHEEARTNRDDFWLYVVAHAMDDNEFRIHRIHNLAEKIAFFGFDDGWKSAEEAD